ncbi:MAG: basic rane lipoprotein, partial [Nocardioidaceae bacterium]|nr:basic rane lipoprotein [Nocardioidaceae bacterium]
MSRTKSTLRMAVVAAVAATVLAACSSATKDTTDSGGGAPGEGTDAIGFITVGPKDDFGYNQAVFEGSAAVKKAYPDMKILTAENVPEDDTAATTMEQMIAKGAKLIFATSYGHLDAAVAVAKAHPDVVVVQQGNTITGTVGKNMG